MNEAEVINLYGQIKTVRGVSKALGLDKYNVCCILAKHGIIDFLKIDDPIVNEIINMYSDNVSVSNIASNLHIAQHTIHYVLLSKKIMMRKRTPKFVKREDFFETIDTEEKAYWLGLLYADGYVNQSNVNVELTLKDEEHVIAFKNAICPTAKVRERTVRLNDKDCIAYRVAISSKKIANDLIKQGCVQAKSLILEWPKYVPDSLIHHFIRGYFDGDGTVGIYKLKNGNTSYSFRIMGTKPFLNSLMNMLYLKLGFSKVKLLARNNCKALTYTKGGKTSFIKFKDFIYHDATIFLKRKKEIFDSISQ